MSENIVPIGELVRAFEAAGITLERDTQTGYFNATRMVDNWNSFSGQNKRLDVFMKAASTKEYIEVINEDLSDTTDRWYRGTGNAFESVKGGDLALRQQGTWMHPVLAIELAGWLNAKVKLACNKVIMGMVDRSTLIIQAPIYSGRDRKEVTVASDQPIQVLPYNSDEYLSDRRSEFGW